MRGLSILMDTLPPTRSSPVLELKRYFDKKLKLYGPTALGVDWNSQERQELCFSQVLKICTSPLNDARSSGFSILDYGCGYGALLLRLKTEGWNFARYIGYDMSTAMIDAARKIHSDGDRKVIFTDKDEGLEPADFVVGSGLLSLKLATHTDTWKAHVIRLMERLWHLSKRGLAFNSLTTYSDRDKMRDDLYYADPCFIFDYCKRNFSRNVALLHDYGAYEFTILVRRDEEFRSAGM